MTKTKLNLAIALLISTPAYAGNEKDPGGHSGHFGGGGVRFAPGAIQGGDSRVTFQPGAVQGGTATIAPGAAQGGNIQSGAVRNNLSTATNTTVSGVGNSSFNYPRQVAPIVQYGYGAASDDHCGASFGINGGAPGGNGGLLFPWTEDHCKRLKASRHFMHELGMPKTACYRFVNGDDDNEEAVAASGESCNNVKQMYVAEPVNHVVPVETPVIDSLADKYPTRDEVNRKFDEVHKHNMGK